MERVLDAENWKLEAQAVIDDIKGHVSTIALSQELQSTNRRIYMNLTTIETRDYCIELSGNGFRVVGTKHDDTSEQSEEYFETPYSLLNKLSPLYNNSFGNALVDKLNAISGNQ